jgi:hypothetical protein
MRRRDVMMLASGATVAWLSSARAQQSPPKGVASGFPAHGLVGK